MKAIGSLTIDQFNIIFEMIKCDMLWCVDQGNLNEWKVVERWASIYVVDSDGIVSISASSDHEGFSILIHDDYKKFMITNGILSDNDFINDGDTILPDYISYVRYSSIGLTEEYTPMVFTVPQRDAIVDLYENIKAVNHL